MNIWDIDVNRLLEQLEYQSESPLIFNSGLFLFLFLAFSLVYWLMRKQTTLRILFVTLFSYYFYYKSSGVYFLILALVTASDYLLGRLIYIHKEKQAKALPRLFLVLSLAIDLGFLVYFKYTNFFGEIWADMTNSGFSPIDIFLPVGISFFTFQSLSYIIDIYRGELRPLKSLLDYAFYVSFFPQLVAGPIVRAKEFIPQIRRPLCVTDEMFGSGLFLIVCGLMKKAVISDYISINFVERVFDQPLLYSGFENLMAVYGYALQIYCDFSGYSDMAIGIALLLGFHFPTNFRSPYKSIDVTDFWRRWHISLSTWLRDYVYISLGGNRHGKIRRYLNLLLTMLIGGLWHGASLNFVFWGGIHGAALIFDKIKNSVLQRGRDYIERQKTLPRLLQMFLTFHFVCVAWIFFRAKSFGTAMDVLRQIASSFRPEVAQQWLSSYTAVAVLMLLGYATHFMPDRLDGRMCRAVTQMPLLVKAILLVSAIYVVIQVKSSEVQPFIYFQF